MTADLRAAPPVKAPAEAVAGPRVAARRRPRGGTPRLRVTRWAVRGASLVTAILVWHLLTTYDVVAWLRFDQIPGPVEVYDAFRVQLGSSLYYQDLAQSLVRILSGFALAAVGGVGIGILLARSRFAAAA